MDGTTASDAAQAIKGRKLSRMFFITFRFIVVSLLRAIAEKFFYFPRFTGGMDHQYNHPGLFVKPVE